MRSKRQCRIVLFISINISGAGSTNYKKQSTKTIRGRNKVSRDTEIFELLMLKNDRAHESVDSEESTCAW